MILIHMIKNLDHFVNDYLDTEKSVLRHQAATPTHTVGPNPSGNPGFFFNLSCERCLALEPIWKPSTPGFFYHWTGG